MRYINKYQVQVDKSHYESGGYLNEERWMSFYHQIEGVQSIAKILNKKNITVLEIGIGNKIVSNLLKGIGMKVTTIDIDPKLKPDYVCALPDINIFAQKRFDCILCCEVLEHILYEDAEKSFKNMQKLGKYCVISVPHKDLWLGATFILGFFSPLKFIMSFPLTFRTHIFQKEHYWELGTKGYSVQKFKESIRKAGFSLIKNHRVPEFPYHHFFILKSE